MTSKPRSHLFIFHLLKEIHNAWGLQALLVWWPIEFVLESLQVSVQIGLDSNTTLDCEIVEQTRTPR